MHFLDVMSLFRSKIGQFKIQNYGRQLMVIWPTIDGIWPIFDGIWPIFDGLWPIFDGNGRKL